MTSVRNNRDDFAEATKRVLAERAAYLCSNPMCRSLTVGPHSSPGKSLKMGIAAHICAAAPDGPRYAPSQTQEERKSIENGMWLCHNCSDLVDKDEQRYPKELLTGWKQQHEIFVRQDGGLPLLPHIEMSTLEGLSMPSTGSFTIDSEQVERVREHVLRIENRSGRVLSYFQTRIQLPEPVVKLQVFEKPPGETVDCKPSPMPLIAFASGGGSVSKMGESRPPFDFNLGISSLPPRSRLEIHFFSMRPEEFSEHPPTWDIDEGEALHFIRGDFQYPVMGEYLQRQFLSLLNFDSSTRTITSSVCDDVDGSKPLQERMLAW